MKAVLRAMTKAPEMRERSEVRLSVTPSAKYSCSGIAADIGERQDDHREARRSGFRRWGEDGLALAGLRRAGNNPDRLGDVLELG